MTQRLVNTLHDQAGGTLAAAQSLAAGADADGICQSTAEYVMTPVHGPMRLSHALTQFDRYRQQKPLYSQNFGVRPPVANT